MLADLFPSSSVVQPSDDLDLVTSSQATSSSVTSHTKLTNDPQPSTLQQAAAGDVQRAAVGELAAAAEGQLALLHVQRAGGVGEVTAAYIPRGHIV